MPISLPADRLQHRGTSRCSPCALATHPASCGTGPAGGAVPRAVVQGGYRSLIVANRERQNWVQRLDSPRVPSKSLADEGDIKRAWRHWHVWGLKTGGGVPVRRVEVGGTWCEEESKTAGGVLQLVLMPRRRVSWHDKICCRRLKV